MRSQRKSPFHLIRFHTLNQKIEEKKKIEEELREAHAMLQSKNVTIDAINEHLKLKEELDKHGVSIQDVDKLLNLLVNVREFGFDSKLIVAKLRKMKRLDKKEKGLENNCTILAKLL